MRSITIRRWFAACMLGSAMAGGCQSTEPKHPEAPRPLAPPMLSSWGPTTPQGRTAETTNTSAVAKADGPALGAGETKVAPPAPPTPEPAPVLALKPASTYPLEEKPILQPVGHEEPVKPAPIAEAPARPSAATSTSLSGFAHDGDYTHLIGLLQHFGRTWRLRYASVDEVDAYGGSVTLENDPRLDSCTDGQAVRVQGSLLEGDTSRSAPRFRINSLEALDKTPATLLH